MKIANSPYEWPLKNSDQSVRNPLLLNNPKTVIRFGSHNENYQKELKTLQSQTPLFNAGLFLKVGSWSIFGLALPAPIASPLKQLLFLPISPWLGRAGREINEQRAKFNTTGHLNALNPFLPYRRLLTLSPEKYPNQLKQYDTLLENILNKAEFYEVNKSTPFATRFRQLWSKPSDTKNPLKILKESFKILKESFKILKELYSFDGRAAMRKPVFKEQKPLLKNLDDQAIAYFLENNGALSKQHSQAKENTKFSQDIHIKKLDKNSQDPSTRTLMAAQITELFFKKPELVQRLLADPKGRPLRFVISDETVGMVGGFYMPGTNIITINKKGFWHNIGNSTLTQHEFIHAASDVDFKVKSVLPIMSVEQKQAFKAARTALIEQYKKSEETLWGKFRYWITGNNRLGIRNYAFFDKYEFLTVTLDAFKSNPKKLIKTPQGQQIYDIYKALFQLDPLNELTPQEMTPELLLKKIWKKEPFLNMQGAE